MTYLREIYILDMKKHIFPILVNAASLMACSKTGDDDETADISKVILSEIDGAQDFIELYNQGDEVSLYGCRIRRMRMKDGEEDAQTLWEGQSGVKIGSGEYLCLKYVSGQENQPKMLRRDFSPKKNTYIWLEDAKGNTVSEFKRGTKSNGWNTIRMQKVENASEVAYSYSYVGGNWVYALPTPGEKNASKAGALDEKMLYVTLNEIDIKNNWIELYNASDNAVDIKGLQLRWSRLKDSEADNQTIWEATKSTQIPAKGYLVLEYAEGGGDKAFKIKLSDYADKNFHIRLRDGSDTDFSGEKYIWDDLKRGEKGTGWTSVSLTTAITGSFARIPDGYGDWYMVSSATKGSSNGSTTSGCKPAPDVDQE